jgi:hypothetical protein
MDSVGQQTSSASGSFSTTSATYVDVTNLSVAITTTGRPVIVAVIADTTAAGAYIGASVSTGLGAGWNVKLLRDATTAAIWTMTLDATGGGSGAYAMFVPGCLMHIDVPAAGTYTYKLQQRRIGTNATFANCKLVAYEL